MAVRGFARYLSAIDPRTQVPPAELVRYRPTGRVAHLFTDDVAAVVRAARASTPFAFRAETLASLIVLLAVTGMRVGEALRLDCEDIDWDQAVVKVRDIKFGKGRNVAVSDSTLDALAVYRRSRDRTRPATTRLFVSLAGTPVLYSGFSLAFRQAVQASGVGAEASSPPRVHDLRHSLLSARCWAGTGPGATSRRCCPDCRPIWGIESRGSPTGICQPLPSCSPMPRRVWMPPRDRAMTAVAPTLESWFTDRLGRQRQVSARTIVSYRDMLRLLPCFIRTGRARPFPAWTGPTSARRRSRPSWTISRPTGATTPAPATFV